MLFLFSDLLSRAFDSWIVPFLGFFLLPWTTLAYAVMWTSSDRVNGFEWFIVILAFLADLSGWFGARGAGARRGRSDRGSGVRRVDRARDAYVRLGEEDECVPAHVAPAER